MLGVDRSSSINGVLLGTKIYVNGLRLSHQEPRMWRFIRPERAEDTDSNRVDNQLDNSGSGAGQNGPEVLLLPIMVAKALKTLQFFYSSESGNYQSGSRE